MQVMGAAALIPSVSTQIQEILDIQVPIFQIHTDSPFAFPSLVDGNGCIIDNFEKGNDALAVAICPMDMST